MMGIFLAYVGFVFFSVLYVQEGLSSQAKFTEFPSNVTATEGQNVEMSCAFQSGSASVYLEIQWWFLRGPEDLEPAAEVAGAQVELVPDRDPDNDGTKISTVKVQGNDISHKLQISKVRKKDEGLYECRVTDANYGELQEHKAQAYLKVNANSHARRMQAFEASPMWLQDTKPRKNVSAAAPSSSVHGSANQRAAPTSGPQAVAKIPKQSPQSGVGLNVVGIVNTYYGYHRFPTKRPIICRKQMEEKGLQDIKYHQTRPRFGGQHQNYQHYEATRRTLF